MTVRAALDGALQPFKELSPSHRKEVAKNRRLAYEASERFKRVTQAYRDILDDARYKEIKADIEKSMGEQLQELLKVSRSCTRCSIVAVRVDALNDIVRQPLNQLFIDAQRSRYESAEVATDGA